MLRQRRRRRLVSLDHVMRFSSSAVRPLLLAGGLVAATFAAFWPVHDNGFVGFDDPRYVTENPQVKAGLTARGVAWAFTTTHAYNWHPLTWISHMADVELFGLDPAGHHLVSVALHAVNAVLLFLVLRVATGAFWPSGFAAFVFALHPLRVESVAWVSERKDVLGMLLWLLTTAAYLGYARRPGLARYAVVAAAFAAGLAAKPMLVTLPLVLLLLDFWPLGRMRPGAAAVWRRHGPEGGPLSVPAAASRVSESGARGERRSRGRRARVKSSESASLDPRPGPPAPARGRWVGPGPPVPLRRLVLEKLPLLGLAAAASAVTVVAQQGIVQSAETFPLGARLANAAVAPVRYLGMMLWPAELAVFYPYRVLSPASAEVLGALAALAALTVLAVALSRRGYPLVGWLWFLGTLVPVSGLVQAGIQSIADRYTYIPGIGVTVAVTWGLAESVGARGRRRAVAGVAGAAVVVTLGALTWRQTKVWRDDESLFSHAVEVTERSYWAHYNLGLTLLRAGRAAEAVPRFEEAARLEPSSREARSNLGTALERAGRPDAALEAFRQAVAIDPESRFAMRDLSRLLVETGRGPEAAGILEAALRRWPEDPELHYTLGVAQLVSDHPGAALGPLHRALDLDPGYAAAHNALGIALARTGDLSGAERQFERAVEAEPGYHEARSNLARMRGLAPSPERGGGGGETER